MNAVYGNKQLVLTAIITSRIIR